MIPIQTRACQQICLRDDDCFLCMLTPLGDAELFTSIPFRWNALQYIFVPSAVADHRVMQCLA